MLEALLTNLSLSLPHSVCMCACAPPPQRCIAVRPANKVLVAQNNVLDRIAAVSGEGGMVCVCVCAKLFREGGLTLLYHSIKLLWYARRTA